MHARRCFEPGFRHPSFRRIARIAANANTCILPPHKRRTWKLAAISPTMSATSGEENMIDVTLMAFAVVAFIGIATPGPTVLLALANGSKFGVRRAMIGKFGALWLGRICGGALLTFAASLALYRRASA